MKQLLLRVDDALHAELADAARLSGRSVNSLAGEILASGLPAGAKGRRHRLVARLVEVGTLGERHSAAAAASMTAGKRASSSERETAIASMRGAGQIIDAILAGERERG